LGLCIGRQWSVIGSKIYDIIFVADKIIDLNLFRRGGELIFPLYLYSETDKSGKHTKGTGSTMMMIFEPEEKYLSKKPNINQEFLEFLTKTYDKMPIPEQIFHYIYAILYSNTYRTKYAEFLKIDFPRIPFTKDYKLFCNIAEYGKKLVDLHLLNSVELSQPISKFQGKGDNRVEKFKYIEREKSLYINNSQYFQGIKGEVWQYQIGGYQVCEKWLKDRKGRILSLDDIKHYCKIVTSLKKTIEIQKSIDNLFINVENDTILFEKF